jgi:AcrR family transcriptional regulator
VATQRAILELSGEQGYANVTIADLLARSGSNRSRFYSIWGGKEDCFVSAYSVAADELLARLLGACRRAPEWSDAVAEALAELSAFTAEAPNRAAGLLGEVHIVGGAALGKREEVFAQLAHALDQGRAGNPAGDRHPPPATAGLILNAIETVVLRALAGGGRVAAEVPALTYLTVIYYRGAPEARRAAARPTRGQRP